MCFSVLVVCLIITESHDYYVNILGEITPMTSNCTTTPTEEKSLKVCPIITESRDYSVSILSYNTTRKTNTTTATGDSKKCHTVVFDNH